jgi:hypothetical protein
MGTAWMKAIGASFGGIAYVLCSLLRLDLGIRLFIFLVVGLIAPIILDRMGLRENYKTGWLYLIDREKRDEKRKADEIDSEKI